MVIIINTTAQLRSTELHDINYNYNYQGVRGWGMVIPTLLLLDNYTNWNHTIVVVVDLR